MGSFQTLADTFMNTGFCQKYYILIYGFLKIYSHKMKNFKSVLNCYVHQLTYQNTTFTHYLEDRSSFSVVFIAPYLMHHSVILWNSPSIHSVNK